MPFALLQPEAEIPFYLPNGQECALFERAYRNRLPLLLKGPTGSGKTRFVAHMAARLGVPLITIACHDDLTAADLTGRYLLRGGDTRPRQPAGLQCLQLPGGDREVPAFPLGVAVVEAAARLLPADDTGQPFLHRRLQNGQTGHRITFCQGVG